MAFSILSGGNGHFAAQGTSGGTSAAGNINTTGATLLVLVTHFLNASGPTVSDNKGNTWALAKAEPAPVAGDDMNIYYAAASTGPFTVGASHTFSVLGTACYASLAVMAFSGTYPVLDQTAGANSVAFPAGTTSLSVGAFVPTTANTLNISGLGANTATASIAIDSGFTITDQLFVINGTSFDICAAHATQSGGPSSYTATWSWTTASNAVVPQVAFAEGTAPTPGYASAFLVF